MLPLLLLLFCEGCEGSFRGEEEGEEAAVQSVDLCIKKLLLLLGRGFAWEESEDSLRGKEEETQVLISYFALVFA